MDKFEEYFRTTERYQDFLCWGSDKWIFKSVDGRYLSEEIQRMYELWQHQQAKVEEANAKAQMCRDEKNHAINRWSVVCKERDELQKRVGAAKQLIEDLNKCYQQDYQNKFEYWRGFADSAGILGKRLEQALKD